MSDSAQSMLVRGIAAAKAGDKDEARFYLKWLLRRREATPEQEAKAWLWLSEVSDDAAEKRLCLTKVLEIAPTDPTALRGLAILDGRLRPEDIIDDRQPLQPLEPVTTARRYICPQCGSKMAFEPDQRALACEHCGHRMREYEAIMSGGLVQEQDFIAALPTARAHRWELPAARALNCQGCGATFALPPACIAGACPFCESPHVVEITAAADLIQPEGVAPFQFDDQGALQRLRGWLKAQSFCPADLFKQAAAVAPRGVYLPFWTFDVGGEVRWQSPLPQTAARRSVGRVPPALSPDAYQPPLYESYPVCYDDLLVPASRSLPADLVDKVNDFKTHSLAPYSPDLLADWPAEIYQISMAAASLVARQRAFQDTQKRIRTHAGRLAANFNSAGIIIHSYKLVLLPVWVTGYRYKGEYYPALVNGQTGRVAGRVPRSGFQKLMATLWGKQ